MHTYKSTLASDELILLQLGTLLEITKPEVNVNKRGSNTRFFGCFWILSSKSGL
jgi:hypothetical protein